MSDEQSTAIQRIPLNALEEYERFAKQLETYAGKASARDQLLLSFFFGKLREQTELVAHIVKASAEIDELRRLRGIDNARFDAKLDAVLSDNETTRRKLDGTIARVDILAETCGVLFEELARVGGVAQKTADEVEAMLREAIAP